MVKALIPWMFKAFDDATIKAYQMMWNILLSLLATYWLQITIVLILLLVAAFIKFLVTGRWAMLGSILNSYIYWGTLFVIGLLFGPGIFANDYFKILLVILYAISLTIVRVILNNTGIRGVR
jgi:hypothetical protein